MPCSVVSSFKLWPEEKTGPAARSTTQRVESSAAAFQDKHEFSSDSSDEFTSRPPSSKSCHVSKLLLHLLQLSPERRHDLQRERVSCPGRVEVNLLGGAAGRVRGSHLPTRGNLMDFAKVQRVGKKLNLMETCHIVFCVLDWLLTIRTRGGAAEERHRRKTRRWDMMWSLPEWKFASFRLIPVPLMRRA